MPQHGEVVVGGGSGGGLVGHGQDGGAGSFGDEAGMTGVEVRSAEDDGDVAVLHATDERLQVAGGGRDAGAGFQVAEDFETITTGEVGPEVVIPDDGLTAVGEE